MATISKIGEIVPPSPIRKLVPFAEAAKKRGVKVYHLNIGQPDIETPEIALQAVKNIDDRIIEYTHSAGLESYRRKLVEYYHSVGIKIELEDLLVTTGGSEAISWAMGIAANPGEEILIPEPYYANYNGFAAQWGVTIKPIESTIDTDFALPAIDQFEKHITPKTRAILICNPNNPTGYLYSREELEQLREIVRRHDLFLITDEVYREFIYDGAVHHSAMNLEGIEQNVIMCDSVSKRYSMCGVRIGAFVTRNREVFTAAMKMAQARLSPPYLGQIAATAAVDTPQSYFDEVIGEYKSRRDLIVSLLNKIDGVYCPNPKGAFYAVVKLPIDDCDRFARWLLEEFSFEGQTVMVAPATGFCATPGLGKDQVRIAYVLKKEDLTAAARCLEEALKVYPGRTK